MSNDEMQALREFRAEIAPPSEETRQRIYAYATRGTPSSLARFWGRRLLPSTSRRLVVAFAGAAICAAAAAVVATGTFTGGGAHKALPTASIHGDQSVGGGLQIDYVRNGGALSSIAVTLNPNVANASVQLQVVHSDATSYAEAYAGGTQVVFQKQVSTTTPSASSSALSTWSGTLSPSNWSGGCQSGLYQIKWVAVQPGTSFANASAAPGNEVGASEWFSC